MSFGRTDASPYLDIGDVATMLGTSTRQVRRLLAAGRLPRATINVSSVGGAKGQRWRADVIRSHLESGLRA